MLNCNTKLWTDVMYVQVINRFTWVDTFAVPCRVPDNTSGMQPDLSQKTDRTSCDGFCNKKAVSSLTVTNT